jgi:hypothetical protein
MSKFINKYNNKTAWIFQVTPELDEVLTKWSIQKADYKMQLNQQHKYNI